MKRTNSVLMACVLLAGGTLTAQEMKSIVFLNQDLKTEVKGSPKGWSASNRDWPGSIKVGKEADGSRFLSIQPLPSPTQKDKTGKPSKMAQVVQDTRFLGGRGRKLRISFQFRFPNQSSGTLSSGIVIRAKSSRKADTWFSSLRGVAPRAKAGVWNKYTVTKKMSDKMLPEEQCYFEICVYGNQLDVKDLKLELEVPKK